MESHSMTKNAIVLVPFPFNGFAASKVRPALCLTSEIGKYQHIIIAFISSKIPHDLIDSDLIIHKNSDDWEGTGLTVDSVVRLHKMVTIPKSLIKRKPGVISKKVKLEITKKLMRLFNDEE
jgi:mRNA interferase MazF